MKKMINWKVSVVPCVCELIENENFSLMTTGMVEFLQAHLKMRISLEPHEMCDVNFQWYDGMDCKGEKMDMSECDAVEVEH